MPKPLSIQNVKIRECFENNLDHNAETIGPNPFLPFAFPSVNDNLGIINGNPGCLIMLSEFLCAS